MNNLEFVFLFIKLFDLLNLYGEFYIIQKKLILQLKIENTYINSLNFQGLNFI